MVAEDEDDLIRRSKAGDHAAYAKLIDAHQKTLFNIAFHMVNQYEDAQDLTQTAFIKAYRRLGQYDGRCPFFGWIHRILINESLDLLARRRRQRAEGEAVLERLPSREPGPEQRSGEQEIRDIVQEGVMRLSVEHRQVIVLRHFAQLSYEEIAQALALSEKTVKSRLFTARQRLREILARRGIATS